MDYTKSKNSARSEVKDKLSKMNSSERAKFKSDREGREYLFESNGNLVIQRPGLSDFSAKWELITGNKKIKITDQNGVVRTYIVVRFQSKRLVLSSIGDNGSNKPVFDQLFLKKQ